MKINEFASQLNKYKSFLGWDWSVQAFNIPVFIRNTFSLLNIYENKIQTLFGLSDEKCKVCKNISISPSAIVYQVDISILMKKKKDISVNLLLNHLKRNSAQKECCMQTKLIKSSNTKYIVLELSSPVSIDFTESEEFEGKKIIINSFVTEEQSQGVTSYCSVFHHRNKTYYQNFQGDIIESLSTKKMVKVISILIPGTEKRLSKIDLEAYKFDAKILKQLDRKCESILNKEKYEQRRVAEKEYERTEKRKLREQSEARKRMHQHVDQVRDKTEARREMHQLIDQVRDETGERRKMHQNIDQVRDKTEARREMHQHIDQIRNKTDARKELQQHVDQIRDKTQKRKTMHNLIDKQAQIGAY